MEISKESLQKIISACPYCNPAKQVHKKKEERTMIVVRKNVVLLRKAKK